MPRLPSLRLPPMQMKTSKLSGVRWYAAQKKWVAAIDFRNRKIHLGYYDTEECAATAYNVADRLFFGTGRRVKTKHLFDDVFTEEYLDKIAGVGKRTKELAEYVKDDGFYEKGKEKYKELTIDYKDSPNGKAFIGTAKRPLQKIKKGHGFLGVVLQDESRKFIQCCSCGKWLRVISGRHLKVCSGLGLKEYKKKYGLNSTTTLISDEMSLRYTENLLSSPKRMENWNKIRKSGEGSEFAKKKKSGSHPSMEYFNKFGTCPLQIKERLYQFILRTHSLPSTTNGGEQLYSLICRRYGAFGNALKKEFGLPERIKAHSRYHTYRFSDGKTMKVDCTNFQDREQFYMAMLQKCPVLRG